MVRIRSSSCGVEKGKRYGWLEVIGTPFSSGKNRDFSVVVRCKCGGVSVRLCNNIARRSKERQSCLGCKSEANKGSREQLNKVWRSMIARCYCENDVGHRNYGGRGIRVCEQWRESYPQFKEWAIGAGYRHGLQLDRRDNDGNYEPGNCRWVTQVQNARNKRTNRRVTAFGETKCLSEWVEDARCSVSLCGLRERLKGGMAPEEAILKPSRVHYARKRKKEPA